ncbi:MAG: hypothetical protein JWQ93_1255 [Marmoricola sp.]|nr:hypothetical protein [Marmoricola sp.]
MGHSPLRRAALARTVLAGLLVLGVTACGTDNRPSVALPPSLPSPSATVTESPVGATGLPDGVDLEVTDTLPGTATGENLAFVSQIFTLAPSGPLVAPAAMRVQLDNALPANTPVVVATRDTTAQPWTYSPGRLGSDQLHVEYTTRRLGQVAILSINLDQVISSFRSEVGQSLVNGAAVGAPRPTCDNPTAARSEGYSVTATKGSTLFHCFGFENDKRIISVTNRRLAPVEVGHAGATVITDPGVGKALALWPRVLGTTNTLLSSGRVATFGVNLEPTKELTLSVAPDPRAQSLRLLQAAVRSLSLRLKSFGVAGADVPKTVTALLAKPRCAKALTPGGQALLTRCLSTARLTQLFGSRGVLLRPLVTAPALRTFFITQGKALNAAQLAERQRIVVRRVAPDYKGIFGRWLGLSRQLTISRTGFVVENYAQGTEPVVDLSYQLGYPVTADGLTTVEAKIVRVKVHKRKLLDGRVPKVGDTGMLQLRSGVITPPFLGIRYCDRANRQKGVCGANGSAG